MSAKNVDVMAWIRNVPADNGHKAHEKSSVATAVAELIERDKVAAQVFDCILRGVNDLSGPMGYRSEQFVAVWLKSWAKSLHAAGFKPSDPTATDIARALANIGQQS